MFRNYLKVALRNLWRNRAFSFINVLGLALGMACSLMIFLWVKDELSYDGFHTHGKQLYRLMENQHYTSGTIFTTPATPGLLAEALKKEMPEVVYTTKITWEQEILFTVGDKAGKETGRYASPDLFRMFTFPLLTGDPKTALVSPTSVVISEKLATKYFARGNAMGQLIRINNKDNFQVTGVMKNIPENSSLKFDYVLPEEYFEKENQWLKQWGNNGIRTFAMLRSDASPEKMQAKIKDFIPRHDTSANNIHLFLQPYSESYLYSNFENGQQAGGRIEYVRLFSVVAVFILVIACINFMNLSTARSSKRAKEVGIRKVVGAQRRFLISQFMGEAVLIALLAIVFSVVMVQLLLPNFNLLTDKKIAVQYNSPAFLLTLLGLTILTGVVAGSYPALFLSSLKPVNVLKGTLKFKSGAVLFRKALVVFQFTLSILLIIGTVIVYRQVNYIKSKNLGLDRGNLLYMSLEGDLPKSFEAFKQELLQAPGIRMVSAASGNPMDVGSSTIGVTWKGKDPNERILFSQMAVGYDFIPTMRIEMKAGRDFSLAFSTDTSNFIINEETARRMRMKEPVGQDITFWDKPGKIIGVMKDFHNQSLHVAIEPIIIRLKPEDTYQVLVRTEPGKTTEALASMEKTFRKYNPAYPFAYEFADVTFERQYKSETVIGKLANYFAILGIFISCLGLFGLAMFTAEQRTKEIGIRKVLGASVSDIVGLLSKDFLQLVLWSNLISWPLAWWAMHHWLQNFAYRIPIGWWIFAVAGVTALLIALLTVSFQAVKSALSNPVKSLRME